MGRSACLSAAAGGPTAVPPVEWETTIRVPRNNARGWRAPANGKACSSTRMRQFGTKLWIALAERERLTQVREQTRRRKESR